MKKSLNLILFNQKSANLVANNILKNLIGVMFVLPENPEDNYLATY